ncbi:MULTISPECIES: acyl-CoA dehydrogenase family protein [Mycobacterium]|jgi:alkylation response protein AidB-like acyl-CoA dehydrogenase|uniref:Acyl-CoA dehydrogenase n=1 Tax=Mycobacterium gordonae TaxID=1778 RepID=A0A1A6B9U2_MYCGO|nr:MULTISPECIES: acyl-CoA dehydrogenase family protein [Mycobacterium]MBI2703204.1 acyl-CoA/acyl-ACP dehydrogenase [Mycobacterium sp.]MBX9982838.1 acyl-CoA/acyl-ACP dehydrogenase [Mycobacterium gordonae]MCV7006763.1 acyl-CoA/acyl-ACP dehydrogenase [Mycobacterium gordonae]OBR99008.1 acyl-CoA dehydrogenase [Mycobacterium gordonae]ODR22483.1 acyl-CoA dehydrogenase [Mycobacterium gordonae]
MTAVDSPEKILFTTTSQAFLSKEASLRHVRELHAAGASWDPAWWRRAAELGWTGLLVPEELGGGSVSGDGLADLAVVAELLGKTVAPGPLYPVSTVLAALADCAQRDTHAALIESLISGETVASWAVSEPHRGWAPDDPTATATAVGSGYRIDGTKDRVEAGAQSAVLLVVARCEDGVRQFLVPTDAPGVRITPLQSVDLVKQFARVEFDGAVATAEVGSATESAGIIDRQSQIAQVLQCAESVGILQTVFDFTVQWALDRHSFGRPLASYQALKHGFADMKLWLEAARATTAAAVADIAARAPDAGLSASIAKSYVGEVGGEIVQRCVQMHGGIGVTWEHDLHLYLRRITLYRSMFGTPEEHNVRVYRAGVK